MALSSVGTPIFPEKVTFFVALFQYNRIAAECVAPQPRDGQDICSIRYNLDFVSMALSVNGSEAI